MSPEMLSHRLKGTPPPLGFGFYSFTNVPPISLVLQRLFQTPIIRVGCVEVCVQGQVVWVVWVVWAGGDVFFLLFLAPSL